MGAAWRHLQHDLKRIRLDEQAQRLARLRDRLHGDATKTDQGPGVGGGGGVEGVCVWLCRERVCEKERVCVPWTGQGPGGGGGRRMCVWTSHHRYQSPAGESTPPLCASTPHAAPRVPRAVT